MVSPESLCSRSVGGLVWKHVKILVELTNPFKIAWHSANAFSRGVHNSYYEVGRLPVHPGGFYFDSRDNITDPEIISYSGDSYSVSNGSIDSCVNLRVILQHNVDFRGQGHANQGRRNATNTHIGLMPPRFFIYKVPNV